MPTFIRVRDKATGIEKDITQRHYDANPDAFAKVNAPSRYPDLSGPAARPRPEVLHTDKAGQPATDTKEK